VLQRPRCALAVIACQGVVQVVLVKLAIGGAELLQILSLMGTDDGEAMTA
jgi:hypothetical protein